MHKSHAALRGFGATSRATFLQRSILIASAAIAATASLPGWAASKPWVTTRSAAGISASGATINGTANPMGAAAKVAFDYGTTTSFGSSIVAAPESLAASYKTTSVKAAVTGLQCATRYYFRARATNSMGTSQASALSFTTGACSSTTPTTKAPTASTLAPTLVTQTSATFNGNVNPGSAAATVSFDAGYTTTYAGSIAVNPSTISAGAAATSVSAAVTGLACATTYHYRVRAATSVGTALGSDQSITTAACGTTTTPTTPSPTVTAPTAITNPATATTTAATLNASVNPNGGSTTVSFEHGATSAYGATITAAPSTIGATAGGTSVSAGLSGLACGKTYNFRVRATNGAGTTLGSNQAFATTACDAQPQPVAPVAGRTYYLSPAGNNTNDGMSAAAAFQTFAKAWAVLQPGDALMVADGSYIAVSPPAEKSGTADKPIAIRSVNPGGARLEGVLFKGNAYINFAGFRINGTTVAVSIRSNGTGRPSHHLAFREIGFSCTPGTLNDNACFALGDGTHHVLLEDSWGFGGGRYTVMCYGGPGGSPPNLGCDYNTFRRLVLRMGPALSSSGNPQASLALYYASYNLVENVIALDGVAASNTSNSAFYITGHAAPPNSDGNRYFGVIALNNLGTGFYLDCSGAICDGVQVRDSVFWGSAKGGLVIGGGSCLNAIIDHVTMGYSGGNGYEDYACTGASLTYSAMIGSAGYGARQSPSAGSTPTAHHNGYFDNAGGARSGVAAGTGDVTADPGAFRLVNQPYSGIGANVANRYQDGVATSTALWPWPNEARIKAEMCADTTRGFCGGNRLDGNAETLTSYIWEYEGHPLPAGMYP